MDGARIVAAEGLGGQLVVAFLEAGIVEAHAGRQQAEDFRVGLGFAHGSDGRIVGHHVQVAIGRVRVHMLELGGGRQHDVGVVRRIGLEMLEHDGEQVFAGEAGRHLGRVRRDGHRIGVVDDHGLDLRAELGRGGPQQVVADGGHVDGARGVRQQVGPLQGRLVGGEGTGRGQLHAAGRVAPGAHQGRQAGDVAHRHAAAPHPLHAVVEANGHRLARLGRLAVEPGQFHHLVHRDAAHLGRAFRRPFGRPLLQLLKAQRVAGQVVMVQQVFLDQHVHHAQRQGRVRARHQGDVLVAFFRRQRAVGVDGNQSGAAPLGFLGPGPEVQVGSDGIAAPDQDQPGILELFQVGADGGAHRVLVPRRAGRGADGAVQQRCPQPVEEAGRHRLALQQAHGAAIAVGQDGFRRPRGDGLEAAGDGGQRLVPADALELALALLAHPAQRMQQALGVVGALRVARHLGAQHAGRGGMVGIPLDLGGHPVFHGDQQGTGVGAVMRAGGADVGGGHGGIQKAYTETAIVNDSGAGHRRLGLRWAGAGSTTVTRATMLVLTGGPGSLRNPTRRHR